jgi:hypothetical protein
MVYKVICVLFAGVVVISGIVGLVVQDQQKVKAAVDRSLAEQQIAKYKLDPVTFQLRCGDAPVRKRTYDGFVISYPAQNVTVGFVVDHGKDHGYYGYGFKRVDYFSMQPLVPITLREVVQRLDCTPHVD